MGDKAINDGCCEINIAWDLGHTSGDVDWNITIV
jgi:hypothetical protein